MNKLHPHNYSNLLIQEFLEGIDLQCRVLHQKIRILLYIQVIFLLPCALQVRLEIVIKNKFKL